MPNSVLLSIKPNFVQSIFSGEKCYEFRRKSCKQKISRIIIYETAPTSKIVGEVAISDIIVAPPFELWKQTQHASGIAKDAFDQYFLNSNKGIAYSLNAPIRYHKAIPLSVIGIVAPPQSYCYVSDDQYNRMLSFLESN